MNQIFTAIGRAFGDLREPRILAVVVLPLLAALFIWGLAAGFFWTNWVAIIGDAIGSTAVARWLRDWGADWLINGLGALTVLALLIPLLIVTTMVITEIFAMPTIVRLVGARNHPALEKRNGGTITGSVVNATTSILLFVALWLISLPLWLTGIGGLILPALLSGYLAQRMFRYDALADYASAAEFRPLIARMKSRLWLLGVLMALLFYVPLLNLFAPVLSGLAFTHFCLAELERYRRESASTKVV